MNDPVLHPALPVLLVDDEAASLQSFEIALRSRKITNLITCQDSREVLPLLSRQPIALMLLDLWMPNLGGEEILAEVAATHPEVPVIIATGVNKVETAVRCLKLGAVDYLVKPVEKDRLVTTVRRTLDLYDLRRENRLLKQGLLSQGVSHPEAFSAIITRSAAMQAIFRYMEAIAESIHPVLITGETGVGKELIATALHRLSNREGEFVPVNIAGLDDNVLADTLFGHRKGAFTGADQARSGLIARARGGTLFLDEIGDLSTPSQIKLLRLLQEGEYLPLGSDVPKRSEARIIVATNIDKDALQQSPSFRKDLFYRLRTHHIHIPPLRERMEDLPLLLDHFLEEAAVSLGRQPPTPPRELLQVLNTYRFPGNIRELRSMVVDAVSSHRSKMLSMDVFKRAVGLDEAAPVHSDREIELPDPLPTFREMEQLLIEHALKKAQGNQGVAARLLGISRQALNRRLQAKR